MLLMDDSRKCSLKSIWKKMIKTNRFLSITKALTLDCIIIKS